MFVTTKTMHPTDEKKELFGDLFPSDYPSGKEKVRVGELSWRRMVKVAAWLQMMLERQRLGLLFFLKRLDWGQWSVLGSGGGFKVGIISYKSVRVYGFFI